MLGTVLNGLCGSFHLILLAILEGKCQLMCDRWGSGGLERLSDFPGWHGRDLWLSASDIGLLEGGPPPVPFLGTGFRTHRHL